MNDTRLEAGIMIGACEAKTRFSELIARAEKGETFVVAKNGRPVARIVPADDVDRAAAQAAAAALRALLAAQGPMLSLEEAQQNWDEIKRELDAEDEEQVDQWLSSSTPR